MQSTYENQVEFNLSESGVHPLTLGELVDDGASRAALLAESLRYTQSNGTIRCASRSRRLSGRDRRSRAGDQRRLRSQLHHDVESRRAGRRSGDDGAELHADVGPGARVRRRGEASGRCRAGRRSRSTGPLASRHRCARTPGVASDQADRHLQSEQPDRRALRRGRSRSHRGHRRPPRQLDRVRRDLSGRRARRPRDPDDVGAMRAGDRHERAVEGIRAARAADRVDRRAAVADGVAVVVSRLHDDLRRAR